MQTFKQTGVEDQADAQTRKAVSPNESSTPTTFRKGNYMVYEIGNQFHNTKVQILEIMLPTSNPSIDEVIPVPLTETCRECGGEGMLTSAAWMAWHRRRNEADLHAPGGFKSGTVLSTWQMNNPMPDGPEETPCPACRGTGLALTANGKAILELVKLYGGGTIAAYDAAHAPERPGQEAQNLADARACGHGDQDDQT